MAEWHRCRGVALRLAAGTAGGALIVAATAANTASPKQNGRFDLSATCTPGVMQVAVSRLSTKVTVKQIANGPRFAGGTKLIAATDKLPAFCQVTGSFVTNPANGKTANFLATFPANWNEKYLQMGCSGHCGQFAVSDPARQRTELRNKLSPLTMVGGHVFLKTSDFASFFGRIALHCRLVTHRP